MTKKATPNSAPLSNQFNSKAEQRAYLTSHGYTNIRYSGKTKTFYFDK